LSPEDAIEALLDAMFAAWLVVHEISARAPGS
jgi:hypothetical protein